MSPLRNPILSFFGLIAVAGMLAGTLSGAMPLEIAAWRSFLLVVVLVIVDRIGLPLWRLIVEALAPGDKVEPVATPQPDLE